MRNTLVDSGPLIALFDPDDKYHRHVKSFLKNHPLRLVTTWPVLTEVCALLTKPAAFDFLEFVTRGGIILEDLTVEDIPLVLGRSRKYADLPMDLADASLVMLAMKSGLDTILSLDANFEIYRLPGKKAFKNILVQDRK